MLEYFYVYPDMPKALIPKLKASAKRKREDYIEKKLKPARLEQRKKSKDPKLDEKDQEKAKNKFQELSNKLEIAQLELGMIEANIGNMTEIVDLFGNPKSGKINKGDIKQLLNLC